MEAPGWLRGHALLTGLAYLAQFFMFDSATPSTSGNAISVIARFVVFQNLGGLPDWFGFLLFLIFPLPWFIFAITLILPLFNNAITGVVAGALILVGALAVITSLL